MGSEFGMEITEAEYEYYRSMPLNEIRKVQPHWACGTHVDKLRDGSQHPEFGSYKVFMVNTIELISNTDFIGFNPETLFIEDEASDYRVITTLQRWQKGEFVDPPNVSISRCKTKLEILDGRHRTKLAYILGATEMPIAIQETMVGTVGSIITLRPVH